MLPSDGRILDLACGTGRLSQAIRARGQTAVGLDFSPPMAAKTNALGVPTVVGDAFSTPFDEQTFDAVASLRFAFHWADVAPLLREMHRLAKPGGLVVFDTYTWSPRAAVAIGRGRWGGRVYPHPRREIEGLAQSIGFRVQQVVPCFMFSPYLYRLAPLPLERLFESLEARLPDQWLCRVFWQLAR